jgi:WD40 repeat protein
MKIIKHIKNIRINDLIIQNDNLYLADNNSFISILNLTTNRETKLDTNQGNISSLAISSTEKHYLFTGGTDCNIKVWDLSTLKEIACFT